MHKTKKKFWVSKEMEYLNKTTKRLDLKDMKQLNYNTNIIYMM